MAAAGTYEALRHYFGLTHFRPGQESLIDAILSGRDALGVMPTGGGKSLCYQIPALLLPGLTLVISPLISLMKDQVAALTQAGVPAAFLNSSLTAPQMAQVYDQVRAGRYKLLYVAPERLDTPGFQALTRQTPIPLVAVDEAHCISQWGQDFRPTYLRIAAFVGALPHRPVVAAFTATATAEVRADILRLLEMRDPLCLVTGFDRPNLYFDVRRPKDKPAALLALVCSQRGKSGIIYCATRAGVESVCAALCRAGVPATRYHAGLDEAERRRNQEDFQYDRAPVMVATNAFGMGIDKSNVSFVIHYNLPKSPEAYYQEAGRAGRDGEAAQCILLYSPADVQTAKFLIENQTNEELTPQERAQVRQQDLARLEAMVGYCRTTKCLRGYLLDYFGQAHAPTCSNCGNCAATYRTEDITRPAQMLLSCVLRVKEKLNYYVGQTLIIDVLRGAKSRRVRDLGLDELSTYGLMKGLPAEQLRRYIEFLEEEGYLRVNPLHTTLEPTARAAQVLFHDQQVLLPVRQDQPAPPASHRSKTSLPHTPAPAAPTKPEPDSDSDSLLATLKALRTDLATREKLPAYLIFSNATLVDMASKAPRTLGEFLQVSGVGQVKAERYSVPFLTAIARYQSTHPDAMRENKKPS